MRESRKESQGGGRSGWGKVREDAAPSGHPRGYGDLWVNVFITSVPASDISLSHTDSFPSCDKSDTQSRVQARPRTHISEQRLLAERPHQALGVHLPQPEHVEGPPVCRRKAGYTRCRSLWVQEPLFPKPKPPAEQLSRWRKRGALGTGLGSSLHSQAEGGPPHTASPKCLILHFTGCRPAATGRKWPPGQCPSSPEWRTRAPGLGGSVLGVFSPLPRPELPLSLPKWDPGCAPSTSGGGRPGVPTSTVLLQLPASGFTPDHVIQGSSARGGSSGPAGLRLRCSRWPGGRGDGTHVCGLRAGRDAASRPTRPRRSLPLARPSARPTLPTFVVVVPAACVVVLQDLRGVPGVQDVVHLVLLAPRQRLAHDLPGFVDVEVPGA